MILIMLVYHVVFCLTFYHDIVSFNYFTLFIKDMMVNFNGKNTGNNQNDKRTSQSVISRYGKQKH